MALLGNILWFVLGGGILLAIEWLLAVLLMAITIVGIQKPVACLTLPI
ncbi:MAG: YccF domain-containing protein [bacterium]|nr:YccF domain-containing protein [bacterium]